MLHSVQQDKEEVFLSLFAALRVLSRLSKAEMLHSVQQDNCEGKHWSV
jgi:hypothetical protein